MSETQMLNKSLDDLLVQVRTGRIERERELIRIKETNQRIAERMRKLGIGVVR